MVVVRADRTRIGRMKEDKKSKPQTPTCGLLWPRRSLQLPISAASMNPAQTSGSAVSAAQSRALDLLRCALAGTILATISIAPDLASRSFSCAKLHHHNDKRSIFSVAFAAHSKFRNGRNN